MKLRLRSIETKENLRLEIPDQSTIDHLKQTLGQLISAAPSALRLSLNRREELLGTPGLNNSLKSLRVTSGDLIYYTLDPSLKTLARPSPPIPRSVVELPNRLSTAATTTTAGGSEISNFGNSETLIGESTGMDYDSVVGERASMVSNSETLGASGAESMEIDDGIDNGSDGIGLKKYSETFFLNRVLNDELGEDSSNRQLLMVAVHAAILDSGFVRFDSDSGMQASGFPLADECPTTSMSISYTLPAILQNQGNNGNGVEGIVVKFQRLGHFVNVYGSFVNGGSGPYMARLDENRCVPMVKSVWKNRNVKGIEVLEFWKTVKDEVTLPLLIDLCAKAGFQAPPSLMRLSPELKMKIFDPLSGVELAKVGFVCKELLNLSNNDDLWEQKYVEEFGGGSEGEGRMVNWKRKFGRNWESRQQHRKTLAKFRPPTPYYNAIRWRDPPNPMFVTPIPGIVGGDYDRFPMFGLVDPSRRPHPLGVVDPTGPPHPLARPRIDGRLTGGRRPGFSPDCNFGGFNS